MSKKKEKKKRAKEAMKLLTHNSFFIGKIRDIFGMSEYDDKDVIKTFKRCISNFLENDDVDSDAAAWSKAFNNNDEDDDDDSAVIVRVNKKDKSKVITVSKNQRVVDEFSDLL